MKNLIELKNVVKKVCGGSLSFREAALISGYTEVHIRNLTKTYPVYGDAIFIHKNKGKKPPTTVPVNERRHIIKIYKDDFSGCNFSFFARIVTDPDYGYDIAHYSDKTFYNILTEAGLKSPENRKVKTPDFHRIRPRKLYEGELLQIDATPYQWFEWSGDTTYYALHGSIDDATGKLTALYMCENECLYGYFELVRQTFYKTGGGHPVAIYSDRAAIFKTPEKKDLTVQEQLAGLTRGDTQWQRAMKELGVKQVLAYSPQAKGRVERMWKTIQGRLCWYFKKYHIKTVEEANKFLREKYIEIFNKEFAREPAEKMCVYHVTGLDPEYVLCARISRRVTHAGYLSFEGYHWNVDRALCGQFVELCVNEHGLKVYYKSRWWPVSLADKDFTGTSTQVLDNIIYKYFTCDMKIKTA